MNKLKLVKYSAKWCGPCKVLDTILTEMEDEGIVSDIERIDIEEIGMEKCRELGITSVPVLQMQNEDGTVDREFEGSYTKEEITDFINEDQD